jgi:hypothetical protein
MRRTRAVTERRHEGRVSASTIPGSKEEMVDENEHPRGALLFILVFLLLVTAFWINAYLRLWIR